MKHLTFMASFTLLGIVAGCSCANTGEIASRDRTEACLTKGYVMDSPAFNDCVQQRSNHDEIQQLRNTVAPRSLQGL